MLFLLGGEFAAEVLFEAGRQFGGQFAEMVARALFHLEGGFVEVFDARSFPHMDAAEEPVGEELVLVPGKFHYFAIEVRVVFFFELVEVVEFGFVEALEHGALIGGFGFVARQLIKMELVQLELHGVADGVSWAAASWS